MGFAKTDVGEARTRIEPECFVVIFDGPLEQAESSISPRSVEEYQGVVRSQSRRFIQLREGASPYWPSATRRGPGSSSLRGFLGSRWIASFRSSTAFSYYARPL